MTTVFGDPHERYGSVGKLDDGREFVLFRRRLPHSVETVWQSLVDPQLREVWFPGCYIEAKLGGHFHIHFGEDYHAPPDVSGTVTQYEPPHRLAFGTMCFELEATDNGCELTFTDILQFWPNLTRTEHCNSVLAGWHHLLDLWEQALNHEPVQHNQAEPDYGALDIQGRD